MICKRERCTYISMSDADKLKQAIVSEDLNKLKKVLRQSRRTELHALHACAQHGYLDGLNYLISKKWDVNARDGENWTALHSSCHSGHLYSVELLLDNGADPSIQTGTNTYPYEIHSRIMEHRDSTYSYGHRYGSVAAALLRAHTTPG